jgi:hypothetical protein
MEITLLGLNYYATSQFVANKSLKAAHIRSLDSFSRRMLRILRAALRCPLALR